MTFDNPTWTHFFVVNLPLSLRVAGFYFIPRYAIHLSKIKKKKKNAVYSFHFQCTRSTYSFFRQIRTVLAELIAFYTKVLHLLLVPVKIINVRLNNASARILQKFVRDRWPSFQILPRNGNGQLDFKSTAISGRQFNINFRPIGVR